jgi:hypothetical protein
MNREQFRTAVFERDHHTCVVPGCNQPAQDAHHIIERALWVNTTASKDGYFTDNGASLCGVHHIHAEKNFITPDSLREWCGIKETILPFNFETMHIYDKWGIMIKSPNREVIKYPHTPYLPFTQSAKLEVINDCGYADLEKFVDMPLVITIKMDGSNCLLTSEKVCARNAYSANHKSFDLMKAEHSKIQHLIPPNIQIFGEWLYAKHSIHYCEINHNKLDGLFQLFAVYDKNTTLWQSWDTVKQWAKILGVVTVPIINEVSYSSTFELAGKISAVGESIVHHGHEGIVIRNKYPFYWGRFSENIAKYVRANHVQTDKHWTTQPIVKNEIVRDD